MKNPNANSPVGDGGSCGYHLQPDNGGDKVFKSGPLFISSKGIGWTSWKKRWFILTRTSLVFFRDDPNVAPQKGSEANFILGVIDLNNLGRVLAKADKRLLTVQFDGRDGRTFTLKAETLENMYEWKYALEDALAQAPSPAPTLGQNGILKNDRDVVDGSCEQLNDKEPMKSTVIGTPILLALEDIDGTPSFLEKALRFIEEHGYKVEGILRQAADVDDVERRVREYDQGNTQFSPEEDAHVIADCIKHVIREFPSFPVPASCCNALLEAFRTVCGGRINAMRAAICETFPEPNRRFLQRILKMMQTVASHTAENRMNTSAVAACMAPLLLRPLLAGHCQIENDFDVGGDGSLQLLQAAAAANHAQAIVITLLDEYDNIFEEGTISPELYSGSEECESESEEATDDDESYEDDDASQEGYADRDDDCTYASSRSCSEFGDSASPCIQYEKGFDSSTSASIALEVGDDFKDNQEFSSKSLQTSAYQHGNSQREENILDQINSSSKSSTISGGPAHRHPKAMEKKNLPIESFDRGTEDEVEIKRLEVTKADLQNRITEVVKENEIHRASLERRKNTLYERRHALKHDLSRLQEQLQKERELRLTLEAGFNPAWNELPVSYYTDEKSKADYECRPLTEEDAINLEKKVDVGVQVDQQSEQIQRVINHRAKSSKDKPNGFDATTTHVEKSRSKETCDGAESESKKNPKIELIIYPDRQSKQYRQLDPRQTGNSSVVPVNSSAAEKVVGKSVPPTNSKKSSISEGTNISALTKFSIRLNFLKERRSQIAHELQNMDRTRGSVKPENMEKSGASESKRSLQSPNKLRRSEIPPEKGQKVSKSRDK